MPIAPVVITGILNAVAAKIQGVLLTDPATNQFLPVVIRKLPRRQEGIGPIPQITVYRSDSPEDLKYLAFKQQSTIYTIYVVIIAAGNQDLVSDIAVYDGWRNAIQNSFKPPNLPRSNPLLLGVPGCWDVRVVPDVWLDRQHINQNYDYQATAIHVSIATNNPVVGNTNA